MKKQNGSVLIALTLAFAAFTLGFFLGRNRELPPVTVRLPQSMLTAPAETAAPTGPPETSGPAVHFPIDINTADKDAFLALPGIGEVLADRILAYRDAHGLFSVPEGLMNVEGIGEKRMEEILEFITIGGS